MNPSSIDTYCISAIFAEAIRAQAAGQTGLFGAAAAFAAVGDDPADLARFNEHDFPLEFPAHIIGRQFVDQHDSARENYLGVAFCKMATMLATGRTRANHPASADVQLLGEVRFSGSGIWLIQSERETVPDFLVLTALACNFPTENDRLIAAAVADATKCLSTKYGRLSFALL